MCRNLAKVAESCLSRVTNMPKRKQATLRQNKFNLDNWGTIPKRNDSERFQTILGVP